MRVERTRLGRLPVKVTPFEGETLGSLIVRAAVANAISCKALLSHIQSSAKQPRLLGFDTTLDARSLSVLLGLDEASVQMRLMRLVTQADGTSRYDGYGLTWSKSLFREPPVRLPLGQAQENLHVRVEWMAQGLFWCSQTEAFLTEKCPACDEPFTDTTLYRGGECVGCALKLETLKPKKIPKALREEARVLSGLLRSDPLSRSEARSKLPELWRGHCTADVFAMLGLYALWSEMFIPSTLGEDLEPYLVAKNAHVSSLARYVAALRLLQNGVDTLHKLMLPIEAPPRQRALKGLVGELEAAFASKLSSNSAVQTLRLNIARVFDQASPDWLLVEGFKVVPLAQKEIALARKLCTTLGIHNRALKRLIDEGACTVAKSEGDKIRSLLDVDAVTRAVGVWRDTLTYPQAASRLGVPAVIVPDLIEIGCLQAELDEHACLLADQPLVTLKSVCDLEARLAELTPSDSEDLMPFCEAMAGWPEPSIWAQHLKRALAGKSAVSIRESERPRLADLLVSEPVRGAIEDKYAPSVSDTRSMTMTDMGKLLGWSSPVAFSVWEAWRRDKGLKEDAVPTVGEVKAIARTYMTASEISKIIGVSSRVVGRVMRDLNVRPILKARHYSLYDRRVISDLFPEGRGRRALRPKVLRCKASLLG